MRRGLVLAAIACLAGCYDFERLEGLYEAPIDLDLGGGEACPTPPCWRTGPTLPQPVLAHGMATAYGRLYVVGGAREGKEVAEVLSIAAGQPMWQSEPPLSVPRARLGVVVDPAGNRIFAVGGIFNGAALPVTEWLEPAVGPTWAQGAPLSLGVRGHQVVATSRYVMSIGGRDSANTSLGLLLRHADPTSMASGWEQHSSDFHHSSFGATTFGDNVYLVDNSDSRRLDALGDERADLPPPPELDPPRDELPLISAPDGRLYAIGGQAVTNVPLADVQAWSPATGWQAVPALRTARNAHAAAVGPDDRIWVAGGTDTNGVRLASVEVYGPVAAVQPSPGRPGQRAAIVGENFAAGATVELGDGCEGTTATTDERGNFVMRITLPSDPGYHRCTLEDDVARYPIHIVLVVM
jgi:hypothetical protein